MRFTTANSNDIRKNSFLDSSSPVSILIAISVTSVQIDSTSGKAKLRSVNNFRLNTMPLDHSPTIYKDCQLNSRVLQVN